MPTKIKKDSFRKLLRFWRKQKRISQLSLSLDLEISSKHLSFLETGKSNPSRSLVLKIADYFKMPFRQKNLFLISAGYSPEYSEESFYSDKLKIIRDAFLQILDKHERYPALVVDTSYQILMKNKGYEQIVKTFAGINAFHQFENSIELFLSPDGFRNYLQNLSQLESFILNRLKEEMNFSQSKKLFNLYHKISRHPRAKEVFSTQEEMNLPVLKFTLQKENKKASFFTILSTLGTPTDVTSQELRLELLFPVDEETKKLFL
ncbi:MAG TPA: helix-turn-helix domain-containing protein [Leptospiraceae bacterium]|nr:helix-turn-helix domain-containing protein [Leptospiraceae bacterium]HMX34597.1 helix-turn-helix domain-containing protein [Leptospiraceae bacterium]HMY34144.1 helix-turn-helix domain-containing protein [Leptospiraceae bacterium]HMZ64729.1 helix-turn-helix domain-containing protein [Leptospiraceae bacterium]HNA08980.1 helix-turn-helix domain-containing protein [Leptospiraceae bacterium]